MRSHLAFTTLLTLSLLLAACASEDEAPAAVVDLAPEATAGDSLGEKDDLLIDSVDTDPPPPVLEVPPPNERTTAPTVEAPVPPVPVAEVPPVGEHTMDDGTVMEGEHDHGGHDP